MVGVGRGRRGGGPSSNKAGAPGGLRASFVASMNHSHLDARQNHGSTQSHFSLSEEARNTERHHSWSPDLKLRHSRISFVSAGTSTAEDLNSVLQECETSDEATKSSFQAENGAPAKAFGNLPTACTVTPDAQMSNMTLKDLQSTPAPRVKSKVGLDSIYERSSVDRCLKNAEASTEAPLIFHKGANKPLHTDLVTPTVGRAASPTGSASSGEFIIFAGRQPLCRKSDQTYASDAGSRNLNASNMSKPSGNGSSMPTVVENPINTTAQGVQTSPIYRPSSFLPLDPEKASVDLSCQSKVTVTRSGRRRRRKRLGEKAKDEGILDDYVANLREGGALKDLVEGSVLNQRDLGSSDTAEWQAESEPPTRAYVENNSMMDSDEWDSAEEDYDELGTSIEVLRSAKNVLSKRQRPSGVQYLVVEAGCTAEKARWFPASSLDIQGADSSIREFENNAELDHLLNDSDSSDGRSTIDEQLARDLQDDFNEQEDEQYLEERRKARTNDEQMARLLSKQDELGLRSDGLILFDGGDVEINSQDELQLDGQWERAVTHRMSKRKGESGFNFPSATAFANVLDRDPYNSSGVMDPQRSNLSKRPKGRRGKLSLELSDSELEYSIRTAWEKDRAKKKLRKEEREELRAQGLLGKKPKKDLKAKYSGGISMTHVKEEIRDFLLSSMESLPLPPMARGERKMVHEIANVFKLKSKSRGVGRSRFPILYRTSRTIQYSDETSKAAESVLSSGRFLPRMDKARRKDALAGRSRRGGAAGAGISYRDGEVVGAAAPEIGQENRGRTMLEKMGWSTGTALGASNNSRGLVQPVAQVVKTSRSGLG